MAPSTLDMFHEKTLECRLRCLVGNVDKTIIDWCKDRDQSKMNELARQLLGAETIHTPVHHVQYMIAKDDKPELGIAWCRIHKWAYSKAMASSMMKGVIVDTFRDGQQISLVPLRSIPTPTQARAIVDGKIKPYSLGVVPIRTGYGVRCLPTDEARVRAALYPNDTNTGINFARVKTRWYIKSCVAGLSEDALVHIASQNKWEMVVLKEFPGARYKSFIVGAENPPPQMRIHYSEGKPPMGIPRGKREAPTKEVQRNNDALVRLLQDRAATHVGLTAEDQLEGPHDLYESASMEDINNEENQYD